MLSLSDHLKPWSELNIACIDFETTGPDPKTCEPVELAVVRFEGGEVVSRYSTLLEPDAAIPPGAPASSTRACAPSAAARPSARCCAGSPRRPPTSKPTSSGGVPASRCSRERSPRGGAGRHHRCAGRQLPGDRRRHPGTGHPLRRPLVRHPRGAEGFRSRLRSPGGRCGARAARRAGAGGCTMTARSYRSNAAAWAHAYCNTTELLLSGRACAEALRRPHSLAAFYRARAAVGDFPPTAWAWQLKASLNSRPEICPVPLFVPRVTVRASASEEAAK